MSESARTVYLQWASVRGPGRPALLLLRPTLGDAQGLVQYGRTSRTPDVRSKTVLTKKSCVRPESERHKVFGWMCTEASVNLGTYGEK